MTPATLPAWLPQATAGAGIAQSLLGGFSALGRARAERQHAERNAYIGETRAIQAGTVMTQDLGSELATMRATVAANGQRLDAGTFPLLQELARTRARERRIAVAGERQGAADWRQAGRNATAQGRSAFLSGILGAGPSMFDLAGLRRGSE